MKHIEPVTLTVTLTGRKAAAFRRMCRYDEQTAQEAADEAIIGTVDAFTEMEASKRKAHSMGMTLSEYEALLPPVLPICPEFANRLADGLMGKLEAAGLKLVQVGGEG